MSGTRLEITVFEKTGGPLTKRIALRDGKIVNDSSACFMSNGLARRVSIEGVQARAGVINGFKSNEAYALGRLKVGLPDRVHVVRKEDLNGGANEIARSRDYLTFGEGEPGFVLLDFDSKAMSEAVCSRMKAIGDLWGALCEVLPAFETVACVERASTSSGLRDQNTGETFPGSGGRHIVVPVQDAADIPRFLSDLHDRCWLKGYGWGMVSAAGSFLERAIIDKSVGSPERLIFEGAPILEPPLEQTGREAKAHDGAMLDTQLCAPLTAEERTALGFLKEAESLRLLPEREAARARWSSAHIARMVAGGMSEPEARAKVNHWIDDKELSGAFPLPFDDAAIAGTTAADVLAAPERYVGKTLSDPFAGPSYGRRKAILYRQVDGSLFVNSFAHGGMKYDLRAMKAAQAEKLHSVCIADVKMGGIKWLWPERFAFGKFGLIAGLPDEGKGQILWFTIGQVTTGGEWPCGEGTAPIGNVVVLEAEDDLKDTVKPRLVAAGADVSKVHFVNMVTGTDGKRRMFNLAHDLELLRAKIEEIGNVVLVVIDPVSAYLGRTKDIDTFRTSDVRNVLTPFNEFAESLNVAIIGIMHFNKKVDVTNVLLRVSDSMAFTAHARHLYGVIDDPENKRKLFVRGKNNSARREQQALAYRFGVRVVGQDVDGTDIEAPYIIFDPKHVDISAADAMASSPGRPAEARKGAEDLLLSMLAMGEEEMESILAKAKAEGVSRTTLFRAKAKLQIGSRKDEHGIWFWFLPNREH